MTGRDAARDELVRAIVERIGAVNTVGWHDVERTAAAIADGLLARGYRRSATPQQIEAAAQLLHDDPTSNTKGWLHLARAAARAFGLEVTE